MMKTHDIIDMHFHTERFSSCSRISLAEGIMQAKRIGLDAVCITDHDSMGWYSEAEYYSARYGLTVLVGAEVLTAEGDLLLYGINAVKEEFVRWSAQAVVDWANQRGGCAIAAHPFRNNGRGLGERITKIIGLAGVEVLNGNTDRAANEYAAKLALDAGLPAFGGSDSHDIQQIGKYSTVFANNNIAINGMERLVEAIKKGSCRPITKDELSDYVTKEQL